MTDDNLHAKNTKSNYIVAYNQFVYFHKLNESDIPTITDKELLRMIEYTWNSQVDADGNPIYKPATILAKIAAVKSIINEKFGRDLLYVRLKSNKFLRKKIGRRSNKADITPEDVNKLITHFETKYTDDKTIRQFTHLRNLILLKLLVFTGQRITDILELKVSNVTTEFIYFKQQKTGTETKHKNQCIVDILKYIDHYKLTRNDYLFVTGHRKRLSYGQSYEIIKNAGLLILSMEDLTPHVFRKYFITQLRKKGLPTRQVKALSGHQSDTMIDHYTGGEQDPPDDIAGLLLSPHRPTLMVL